MVPTTILNTSMLAGPVWNANTNMRATTASTRTIAMKDCGSGQVNFGMVTLL